MNFARGLLGGDFCRGGVAFGTGCPQIVPLLFRFRFDSDPCESCEHWDACDNELSRLKDAFDFSGESSRSPKSLLSSLVCSLIRLGGSFVGEEDMELLGAKIFAFRDLRGLLKGSGASNLAALLEPSRFATSHVSQVQESEMSHLKPFCFWDPCELAFFWLPYVAAFGLLFVNPCSSFK